MTDVVDVVVIVVVGEVVDDVLHPRCLGGLASKVWVVILRLMLADDDVPCFRTLSCTFGSGYLLSWYVMLTLLLDTCGS